MRQKTRGGDEGDEEAKGAEGADGTERSGLASGADGTDVDAIYLLSYGYNTMGIGYM